MFIAIYNDQGWKSRLWWRIKYFHNKLPGSLKTPFAYGVGMVTNMLVIAKYTLKLKPMVAITPLLEYKTKRGMSLVHDMVDWVGGFPYEVVSYASLKSFFEGRGFKLLNGKEATSIGCHEMVFGAFDVRHCRLP